MSIRKPDFYILACFLGILINGIAWWLNQNTPGIELSLNIFFCGVCTGFACVGLGEYIRSYNGKQIENKFEKE